MGHKPRALFRICGEHAFNFTIFPYSLLKHTFFFQKS